MDSSEHVFFSGHGAGAFAAAMGQSRLWTSGFYREGAQALPTGQAEGCKTDALADKKGPLDALRWTAKGTSSRDLDRWDDLQKHGRIGDSPIIGAGTWADNRTCAVSATGWGSTSFEPVLHKTSTVGCCTVTNRWSRRVAVPFLTKWVNWEAMEVWSRWMPREPSHWSATAPACSGRGLHRTAVASPCLGRRLKEPWRCNEDLRR